MDDREILELAAKACGDENLCFDSRGWFFKNRYDRDGYELTWNPRDDDAAALRLAVRLKLDVCIESNMTEAVGPVEIATEAHLGDPYAATRRAIVRAAAEIGKAMN